jgi:PIN domain nuclease of toxin-antitoxin system
MRFLLDTHTVLWYFDEIGNLSERTHDIIAKNDEECFVSIISLYEMAIKVKIKKLQLKKSIDEYKNGLIENGFTIIPIEIHHLDYYTHLPQKPTHKDPFDRLIISTAAVEGLKIISKDEKFNLYQDIVETVW